MEHSESELTLVHEVGNSSKYEDALKSDNLKDYNRWLYIQAGKLNWGSPLLSFVNKKNKGNLISS